MAYNPNNSNGQKTMANSAPVVIASDQATISVSNGQTQPLTDTQLRATAVPISLATAPTTPVTGTFWQTTQPVSLATNTPVIAAGTAIIGKVGIDQTTPGTTNAVSFAEIGTTTVATGNGVVGAGVQRVAIASDNSAIPVSISSTVATSSSPATTGGLSVFHLVSAASTNATNLKASAGQLYGWYIYNSNAAARKIAFHNTAGTPTAGASILFAIVIPPSSGANVEFSNGIVFSTGIAITTVTDLTDAGTTAVALNDLVINIMFK